MSAKTNVISISNQSIFLKPKLDYLKELSGGDRDFIAEILEMFIAEAPQAIAQSFQHLEKNNFDLLRITVHKLKSSVQVVGGYHLSNIIHEIESATVEKGKPDLLHQMLTLLDSGIRQLVEHLAGELKGIRQ